MSQTQPALLDPESIKRLKRLNLTAKLIVRSFFQGLNASLTKGCSIDFADLREYSPGDDLRLLDWKAYARTDRFYVRQFEAERDATIIFLLDASPSMSFASNGVTKFEYAKYLLAALAFIGSGQHDRVGLFTSPGQAGAVLPPHRGRAHLQRLLRNLASAETNRDTAPFPVFYHHVCKLKKRSIIVLVSDLLGERADISTLMRRAAFGGHSVIFFHTLDRAELDLPYDGNIEFQDLESPWRRTMRVNESLRAKYRQELTRYCDAVRGQCSRLGIEYVRLDTTTPYDVALISFLMRRRRLHASKRDYRMRWIRS